MITFKRYFHEQKTPWVSWEKTTQIWNRRSDLKGCGKTRVVPGRRRGARWTSHFGWWFSGPAKQRKYWKYMKKMQLKKAIAVLISAGSINPGDARVLLGSSAPWGLIGSHSQGGHNLPGTNCTTCIPWFTVELGVTSFGLPSPSSYFSFEARCSAFFANWASLKYPLSPVVRNTNK